MALPPGTHLGQFEITDLLGKGRMEDVAGLAIFLSSRAGSFLSGVFIPYDGGQRRQAEALLLLRIGRLQGNRRGAKKEIAFVHYK